MISHRAAAPLKWPNHPNLRLRPARPAAGNGRIQVAVRRAFVAADSDTLSSSEVFDWALARVRRDGWRRRHRWSVIVALRQVAEPIGRARTIGRPWLWRLRNSDSGKEPSGTKPLV
jgi:hypothetical protein